MYEHSHIDYPDCSVYDFLEQNCKKYSNCFALDYFSRKISYKSLNFSQDALKQIYAEIINNYS